MASDDAGKTSDGGDSAKSVDGVASVDVDEGETLLIFSVVCWAEEAANSARGRFGGSPADSGGFLLGTALDGTQTLHIAEIRIIHPIVQRQF